MTSQFDRNEGESEKEPFRCGKCFKVLWNPTVFSN